jgi:hypothetical protein
MTVARLAMAVVVLLGLLASGLMASAPDDSKNVDLVYGAF